MQKDSLKNILNVAVDDDYNPGDYLILHLQFSYFLLIRYHCDRRILKFWTRAGDCVWILGPKCILGLAKMCSR